MGPLRGLMNRRSSVVDTEIDCESSVQYTTVGLDCAGGAMKKIFALAGCMYSLIIFSFHNTVFDRAGCARTVFQEDQSGISNW